MPFLSNPISFPGLPVKIPTVNDSLMISDQAAAGALKQSIIENFPAITTLQITQYNQSGTDVFSASFPGMMGPTQSDSITQGMGTALNSSIFFMPFYLSTTWTTAALYVNIKGGLASSTITMGIYASTPPNGGTFANLPTGAALAAGQVATATSNTVVNAPVVATLSPNSLYWAAIQLSSATTLAIAVASLTFGPPNSLTANVSRTAMTNGVLSYGHIYSAGTFPTITQSSLQYSSSILYGPIINGV